MVTFRALFGVCAFRKDIAGASSTEQGWVAWAQGGRGGRPWGVCLTDLQTHTPCLTRGGKGVLCSWSVCKSMQGTTDSVCKHAVNDRLCACQGRQRWRKNPPGGVCKAQECSELHY